MRKYRRVDRRLLSWPPVRQTGNGLELRAKFLTPLRFSTMQHLVLEPLSAIWRLAFFVLIIDGALSYLNAWSIFPYLPVQRTETYIGMTALYLLWWWELASCYPIGTLLFGKYLLIRLQGDTLLIGGRFRQTARRLDLPVTFGIRKFEFATLPAWRYSVLFVLIVDNASPISIAEVFGVPDGTALVTNANLVLQLGGECSMGHLDVDPTWDDDFDD